MPGELGLVWHGINWIIFLKGYKVPVRPHRDDWRWHYYCLKPYMHP